MTGRIFTALFLVATLLTAACAQEEPTAADEAAMTEQPAASDLPSLERLWTLDGFAAPEGAVLSADGTFYYISNMDGGPGDIDGAGFISRISLAGEMLERDWVSGMNAPKGMALSGGSLFVADVTVLRRIDTATGELAETIEMPGSGLNDVTVSPELGILVSDSAAQTIYQYKDGEISVFADDERLAGINGILAHDGTVLAVTMPAGNLVSIEPETGDITIIASGMENADMLAPLENDGYLVSCWPGVLWYVSPGGEPQILQDTREGGPMMADFVLNGDTLVVPTLGGNSVIAYRLSDLP